MGDMAFSSLYQNLLYLYFRVRTYWPFWFYILNYRSRRLFLRNKPPLDTMQERILGELKATGIAITSLEEFFPSETWFPVLREYTNNLLKNAQTTERKKFLQDLWDPQGELDFTNPFLRLVLTKRILDVVNSYLGMYTRLKYITLQRTIPVPAGAEPVQSQRWHRDPQEKRMCKVFIYLSDVDKDAGPFTYLPKSTYGKRWGNLFPQKPPLGSYPPVGEMEKVINPEEVLIATGKAGVLIFCDTSGLHKGGYATRKERIMFTAFYAAPTFVEESWYTISKSLQKKLSHLDESIRFALRK